MPSGAWPWCRQAPISPSSSSSYPQSPSRRAFTSRSRSPRTTSRGSTRACLSITSSTTPRCSARCAISQPARTSRSWWSRSGPTRTRCSRRPSSSYLRLPRLIIKSFCNMISVKTGSASSCVTF